MQRFELREQVVRHLVLVDYRCDGCGVADDETDGLIPVAIEVNLGEEGGRRDEFDFCDPCLRRKAAVLVAAGSRAPLVTGEDEPAEEEVDDHA